MKTLVLAASLSLLALGSCTKGDDPDIKINTLKAKIDGSTMTAEEIAWSMLNGQLQLQGTNGSRTVTIKVPRYEGKGSYVLSATDNEANSKVSNTVYTKGTGMLIIMIDDSHYLKGKFSFSAEAAGKQVKVEDGDFSFSK
ncbi:MAG: hypothetical protein EOO88_27885 [Pedobacter sp.]|nr:MAG: hypothetical protein EOO88_27885 [Pedobacter sp.]